MPRNDALIAHVAQVAKMPRPETIFREPKIFTKSRVLDEEGNFIAVIKERDKAMKALKIVRVYDGNYFTSKKADETVSVIDMDKICAEKLYKVLKNYFERSEQQGDTNGI